MRADILIVGSGCAGAQCAISLVQGQFPGSLMVISDDECFPYELPPLTKGYLSGDQAFADILVRPEEYWSESGVEFLFGRRVVEVLSDSKVVRCDTGEEVQYGQLVWAAGARPRILSCKGADLTGVYSLRNRSDADEIIRAAQCAVDVMVVGGGYIGLEVAASLSKLDVNITVVEASDRILSRVTGDILAGFVAEQHANHGVDILSGAEVVEIKGEEGRVSTVVLSSGEELRADLVIAGIGIEPNIEPLAAVVDTGAKGVIADEYCRSSDPDIFVAGDCCEYVNSYAGGQRVRLESVQNANDQASTVAKNILGANEKYEALPWFWSDQYDLRIQTVGLSAGYDDFVVRGSIQNRQFSIIYLSAGEVIALDCVNTPKDYIEGRKLVKERTKADPHLLASADTSLRDITRLGSNARVG